MVTGCIYLGFMGSNIWNLLIQNYRDQGLQLWSLGFFCRWCKELGYKQFLWDSWIFIPFFWIYCFGIRRHINLVLRFVLLNIQGLLVWGSGLWGLGYWRFCFTVKWSIVEQYCKFFNWIILVFWIIGLMVFGFVGKGCIILFFNRLKILVKIR